MVTFLLVQVYRVGVVKDLLVSHEHSSSWLLNSDLSKEDAPLVSYSPWMNSGSCDPHVTVLKKYQCVVQAYIFAHPGVTMVRTHGCTSGEHTAY